jgi:hypothetical protein
VPHQLKLAAAAALVLMTACEKQIEAPRVKGACYHMVEAAEAGAPPKFNRLPGRYEQMEYCAAALEKVRLMGGRQRITGSYQGLFIFAQPRGIFFGKSLDGPRYLALMRTGRGTLAAPGAIRE